MEKVKFENMAIEEISKVLRGGIRIRKYEASDLISGKKWKGDNAVLPNSMWSNTFAQEGMEFYYGKDGRIYTNEVIYLDFESCLLSSEEDVTRSIGYVEDDIKALQEEVDNLLGSENDLVEELVEDLKEKINGKKEYMDKLKAKDKDDFTIEESLRVSELRKKLYLEGFVITREEENGTIYEDTYRVIFQNSSKSRLGKTIWVKDTITKINKKGKRKVIREGMVKRIHSKMSMGITDKLTEKDVIDLVSLEAYTALSQSAITNGYLKLDVDSILIVKDFDQKINFNAVSVGKDLIPRYIDNYEGKNTLWDGEMLGDSSLFIGETEKYDMVLLRQCYFKSAMFKCDLVDYIKSFCAENGIDYETATVKDMFGNDFKVKNIRAITTDNSCKWLKFTKTMFKTDKEMFEHFKSVVKNEWKDLWAVVKHDCGTKYGSLVKMSYQMTNSLVLSDNKEVALEELKSIVKPTESYLRELQCDIEAFKNNLKVLHKNEELAEMYLDLLEVNSEVENTKEFQKFRRETINSIKTKAENGEVLLNGNNLTLCGNPVELIEYALTGKFEGSFGEDNVGAVKCYTKRFGLGEELAGMRSPQNYKSGLVLLKNVKNEKVEKLFSNIGNNVIIVDSLQYPVEDMWNGSDWDSDFICTTNNVDFVKLVKNSFGKTPIPVNNIPQSKNVYPFSMEGKWEANSKLKNSFIGQITNLAQIAVSHISELKMNKDKYLNAEARIKELEDIAIILVVLSNVAIDSAKRVYDVDLGSYLRSCKKSDCWIKENGKIVKPSFFKGVSKNKADKLVKLDCNVDMLTVETYKSYAQNKEIIELLDKPNGKYNDKQEGDIYSLLEEADKAIRKERMRTSKEENDTYKIVDDIKLDLERSIQKKKIKETTFIHIIRLCFTDKKWSKYRALCLSAMFKYKSKDGDLLLQKCLKK